MGSNEEETITLSNEEESIVLSNDVGKLKELLRQESHYRRETGNCYDTLQKEYDALLCKYAEAENTIDKLRIGARIDLYSNGPKLHNASPGVYHERSKSVQQIKLPKPHPSAVGRAHSSPGIYKVHDEDDFQENVEATYMSLYLRLQDLQEDVSAFQNTLLDQDYDAHEKKQLYDVMKKEFDDIKEDFEQNQVIDSQSPQRLQNDENTNHLEEEFHDLGLRLEEIDEEISEQIRSKHRKSQSVKHGSPYGNTEGSRHVKVNGSANGVNFLKDDVFTTEHNEEAVEERRRDVFPMKRVRRHKEIPKNSDYQPSSPEKSDYFDEKYLSRSLDIGGAEKRSCCNEQTEHSVHSWLRYNFPNKNPHNQSEHFRKKAREEMEPADGIYEQKAKETDTPTGVRPNTMNSTEDSGFIDTDQPRYRVRNKSYTMLSNHPELSHDNDLASEMSAGQMYRERLDSLRDFIQTKRKSRNTTAAISPAHRKEKYTLTEMRPPPKSVSKTPRSWVRGVSPKPQFEDVPIKKSNLFDDLMYEDHQVRNNHSPTTTSRARSYSKSSEKHQPEEFIYINEEGLSDVNMPENSLLHRDVETLREEMKNVRDLVLDLRSSLLKQTPQNTSSLRSRSASVEDEKPSLRVSDGRSHKQFSRYVNRRFVPIDSQVDRYNGLNNHLKKLTLKIDRLSSKLEEKNVAAPSVKSYDSMKDDDPLILKISEENNNEQEQMLQNLSSKVEQLSTNLKKVNRPRTRSVANQTNEDLFSKVDQKLEDLAAHFSRTLQKHSYFDSKTKAEQPFKCSTCKHSMLHQDNLNYLTPQVACYDETSGGNHELRYNKPATNVHTKSSQYHLHHLDNMDTQDVPKTSPCNVYHHYHTFHEMPDSHGRLPDKRLDSESLDASFVKHPRADTDRLQESIMGASFAAQKMEKHVAKNVEEHSGGPI